MFIRVNRTPNSPRRSIQICQNFRKGDKVKQKIIRYVGVAQDEYEEQKLKDYAKELIVKIKLELEKNSSQQSFLDISEMDIANYFKSKAGRPKRKKIEDILPPSQVNLDDIAELTRVVEGVHDVAGKMFDDMYGELLNGKRTQERLRDVVLSRLVYPCSKRGIQQKLEKHFGKKHDLNLIYQMMDQLVPKIEEIKKRTFVATQSLFPEKIDLLLFDVTTLYFESVEVDELRNFGYSKDHRFNTTQVVLALATNQDGLPIGYELFEGNKAEVTTLIAAIESWKVLFKIDSVCFVGDRAMFTNKNIQLLEQHQYHYIIAAKLKKLPTTLQEKIFQESYYRPSVLGKDFAWIGEFVHSLCDCSLLSLTELPNKEDYKSLPGNALFAYAFINDAFYYLSKPAGASIKIEVTTDQLHELRNVLKVRPSLFKQEVNQCLRKKLSEKQLNCIMSITGHVQSGRLILSYKSKRAQKDQKDRQRVLDKIQKRIGKKANPNELITNQGVKQFVTRDKNAVISLDETKIAAAAEWDGLHGIITNIQDDSPQSLIARYARLWIIEESFRLNKYNLEMRPIFHWVPPRIHAHIAICYMTFSILRHLQYRVNLTQKISVNEILDELLNVQASIHIHKKTKDKYRVPGYFTNKARKIYKAFEIERSLDATVYLD